MVDSLEYVCHRYMVFQQGMGIWGMIRHLHDTDASLEDVHKSDDGYTQVNKLADDYHMVEGVEVQFAHRHN